MTFMRRGMLSNDQKKLLTTGIGVVAACALAWYLLVDHNQPKQQVQVSRQLKHPAAIPGKSPRNTEASDDSEPKPLPPPTLMIKPRQLANLPPLQPAKSDLETDTLPADVSLEEIDPTEPQVPLEVARSALGLVGADPQAEEIWYAAINDPNTPAKARQDLIEDLNEDGFDDPRNITEDDLPLIYSRIALIEQLGPEAMDDVNAAAFAEAYKDLVNMVMRLEQEAILREEALEQAQAAGEETNASPRRPLRR